MKGDLKTFFMTLRNSALMLLNRWLSIGRRCLMSALPEKIPLR